LNVISVGGLKSVAPWPIVAAELPLLHMQLAFAIGLIGIYAGWRGVIARMTGFYDLAGAVKYLLYGIVSGMVFAVAIDEMILQFGVIEGKLNIIEVSALALLIGASQSALVMFLVGRPRVVNLRASPPYGWTLGLGFGSMFTSVLLVRLFDPNLVSDFSGFSEVSILMAVGISAVACIGHAMISAYQGSSVLQNKRLKSFYVSSFARAGMTVTLVLSLFTPFIIMFIAPILLYYWPTAQKVWLPMGMTPAAAQAYRRTIRQSDRMRQAADDRIRGEVVFGEE
jgi:hypothetical protein